MEMDNNKAVARWRRKETRTQMQQSNKVMAVAVAAGVVALNGNDRQWPGGGQHDKREGADNVRQGGDHRCNNQIEVACVVAVVAVAALNCIDGQWPGG